MEDDRDRAAEPALPGAGASGARTARPSRPRRRRRTRAAPSPRRGWGSTGAPRSSENETSIQAMTARITICVGRSTRYGERFHSSVGGSHDGPAQADDELPATRTRKRTRRATGTAPRSRARRASGRAPGDEDGERGDGDRQRRDQHELRRRRRGGLTERIGLRSTKPQKRPQSPSSLSESVGRVWSRTPVTVRRAVRERGGEGLRLAGREVRVERRHGELDVGVHARRRAGAGESVRGERPGRGRQSVVELAEPLRILVRQKRRRSRGNPGASDAEVDAAQAVERIDLVVASTSPTRSRSAVRSADRGSVTRSDRATTRRSRIAAS